MSAYGTLCTEFYDLDKPQAPAPALDFYLDRARQAGGRVLEPMCGSGRFLVPLLRAGLPVDGTDASVSMIAACRRRLAQEGLEAEIFEQTIEQLALPHRYRLAFIPSGSIGLLASDEALGAALRRLRAHLEPGATLLMEFFERDSARGASTDFELEARSVHCPDGAVITYRAQATRLGAVAATRYTGRYVKSRDGQVLASEEEELVVREFAAPALCAWLRGCGFAHTRCLRAGDLPFLADGAGCLVEAS